MESTDFNPIVHQDLINSRIGMLPQWGGGMYQTNLLHGMSMPAQPDADKFVLMKKKDKEERNAFLISMGVLLAIGTSAALLFKGKINYKNLWNSISAPFKWLYGKSKGLVQSAASSSPAVGSGLKKFGHAIAAPFKWLGKSTVKVFGATGRGLAKAGKAVGRVFAAPFKWIGSKFHKKP